MTLKLAVDVRGVGSPVLLLHGFPDSRLLWRDVTPGLLALGHQVIAPDLRGFGESDAPPGRQHYRTDHVVRDLLELLDRHGVHEEVRVIGHDWGSVIGWCLAMAHPGRVHSLVAVSVGHPRAYATSGFEQKRKGFYTVFWQLPGIAEAWLERKDYAGLRHWARQRTNVEDCIRDVARPGRLTAGLNWYRANLRAILLGAWPRCRVPVRGIWGSEDSMLAEDQMVNSARHVDAPWDYVRVEGRGHWLPLDEPQRIVELADDWFRRG